MVRLHTSLLAVSLATGSVLASFSENQRRDVVSLPMRHLRFGYALGDHSVQSRELEDLFGRDNLETREPEFPVGAFAGGAKRIGRHVNSHNLNRAANAADNVNSVMQLASSVQKRGLEDEETLVGRESNIPIGSILKAGRRFRSMRGRVNTHKVEHVAKVANGVSDGMQAVNDVQNRGLEDEGPVKRGLEVEEFFGREYDYLLEERDTFDDLD